MTRKRTIHERVMRAERALNELDLSLTTKADKERWYRISDGLNALDEEQAKLKAVIWLCLDENRDIGSVTIETIMEALAEEGISLKPLRESKEGT